MIWFNDGKRSQIGEHVRDKDPIADIADIPGDTNNCLSFKNNVEYEWARFMQVCKMTKRSMTMFFNYPTLAPMREYQNYKNMDKMRALLTELLYGKIIW